MSNNPIQIDHLLDHVSPCNLHIIHDGIDSSTFHSNGNHLPTEIFFPSPYKYPDIGETSHITFPAIDVTKSRFGTCRIAIVLMNFFTSLSSKWRNHHKQKNWMEFVNEEHFFVNSTNGFFVRDKKLFVVVVGHREKAGGLSLFMQFETFSKHVYNLGITFISREGDNLISFCVKGQDGEDVHEGNLNCVDKMDNLVTIFIKLSMPPKYWCFAVKQFNLQKDSFKIDITLVNNIDPFNPFDRSNPYTVEHLAQAVFRKANATLFSEGSQIIKLAQFELEDITEDHWVYTTVNLKFVGFQFLTCYVESYLTFRFYLDPFQPNLWVGLGICLFLITAIVWMYVRNAEVGNVSFSPWLFVLSSLLEEAYLVPMKIVKLIIFPYRLGVRDYEIFHNTSFVDLQNQHDSSNCYKLLSTPVQFPGYTVFEFKFLIYLKHVLDHLLQAHLRWDEGPESVPLLEWPHLALMLQLLNPHHAHFPKEIDYSRKDLTVTDVQKNIETEVVDCSRKTVFIAKSDLLQFEYEFLTWSYYGTKFHKGKEILNPLQVGLIFEGEGLSKVPKYYKGLIETGIYARVEKEVESMAMSDREQAINRRNERSFSLGLDGGIVTLFILCGVVVTSSILCFWFEYRIKIARLLGVLKNRKIDKMMLDSFYECKTLSRKKNIPVTR
ncbi:hypothetical protein Fcan01_00476 [Folsomia candida]|uniref:Uncharacterized protein n=1 Tax=Folsomia candida TaxID=158441 RepID=A0A226F6K1_FOLCA|nr:hypothetical protein Fcan01_00476 [Folsomia candida]